mmetsp:Transcript_42630/g.92893  ORF Transcript_42630/g.92893 Transcript_42630/m.92893 type:complete len:543 (-) Transcript_42630:55-1683(-)
MAGGSRKSVFVPEPAAVPEGDAAEPSKPSRKMWSYGLNGHCEELPAEHVKSFKGSGSFRTDFAELCERCGVVPHAALAPSRRGTSEDGPVLSVQAMLLDHVAAEALRVLLPTSWHLEVIRFSGCCLDVSMLALLRAGLTESCTVTTLHLDWNPLEVPIDAAAVKAAVAQKSVETLDELEISRHVKQTERTLCAFRKLLLAHATDLNDALRRVAQGAVPDHPATAMLEPLTAATWVDAFEKQLRLPSRETAEVFMLLDDFELGQGDGRVPLDRLEQVLSGLPEAGEAASVTDQLGVAFGGFLDGGSCLESMSYRCCSIGYLEVQAMGAALKQSRHLRALNLWGNRLCDASTKVLAEALEAYYGLQYLGLGQNFLTHVGLESLCKVLGKIRVAEKELADRLSKEIKLRQKEKDKLLKKPEPPKKDGRGRDRYQPEFRIDSIEEFKDAGQTFWTWTRNCALRTLNLEGNLVADAASVLQLRPQGVGDLILRGVPCVEALRQALDAESAAAPPASDSAEGGSASAPAESQAVAEGQQSSGWRLVLN